MKRQKRNQWERAFCKGYQAASENKAQNLCPYVDGPLHQEWMNGWREGREDYWNGFKASAKAQKLESYRTFSAENHHPDGWRTV
ncbi:ribosome modulation factor [Microbulbifer aestuariivivens]|uniref:Ribosome modulation factor n=1 Tax=Microbulbifer aestuariivivens TaxID=1908308 RepID=A0ABP9WK09_9GAMM